MVVREFPNPEFSRAGLGRCLRRHGMGNPHDMKLKVLRPEHSAFPAAEAGRTTPPLPLRGHVIAQSGGAARTAANAWRVPRDLVRACPIRIQTIGADNVKAVHGSAFPPAQAGRDRGTGAHEFDWLGIDHRLTPSESPRINGMA
ncbi:MAG: IS481 family transposase, partial [Rhodobacteraceae bacterium]|nr:IS481 family transposase [Paracoccaceae bacterium]